MRVLLIRTTTEGVVFRPVGPPPVAPPIGVLSLAAALRAGCPSVEVSVLDLAVGVRSIADVAERVRALAPDIVGLSAMTLDEGRLFETARTVRAAAASSLIVAGGPHATLNPERVLSEASIDLASVGEGERTLVEIAERRAQGVSLEGTPGTAWRAAGEVRRAPRPPVDDLDTLPLPAWELVDLAVYSSLFNFHDLPPLQPPYAPILTSRGCPWHCSYCHNLFGRRFRPRSAESVVEEVLLLKERHGVGEIHVIDDVFNLDGDRLLEICDGLIRARADVKLAFPNGLRGDVLERHHLEALRAAGCYSVTFALETVSPRLQRLIRKNLKVERVLENAAIARELGLITSCFVMLGFPTETREELEQTVATVVDSAFDLPRFFTVCPFPGTELHAMVVGGGFDPRGRQGDDYDYDTRLVNVSPIPDHELEAARRDAQTRVLSQPERLGRLATILSGVPDVPQLRTGFWREARERLGLAS